MSNKLIFVLIVISLLIIGLLYRQNQYLSEIINYEKGFEIGDNAPMFESTDFNGQKVTIKNKNALLIFFNSTCQACKISASHWQDLFEKYSSKEINIIGISSVPEIPTKNFVLKHELTFPVILDHEQHIMQKYRIKGYPQIVVVDKNGKILLYQRFGIKTMKMLIEAEKILQRFNKNS